MKKKELRIIFCKWLSTIQRARSILSIFQNQFLSKQENAHHFVDSNFNFMYFFTLFFSVFSLPIDLLFGIVIIE